MSKRKNPRGPGRPVSTGSKTTPRVSFAVGATEFADLSRRADAAGESVGQYAKRRALALE